MEDLYIYQRLKRAKAYYCLARCSWTEEHRSLSIPLGRLSGLLYIPTTLMKFEITAGKGHANYSQAGPTSSRSRTRQRASRMLSTRKFTSKSMVRLSSRTCLHCISSRQQLQQQPKITDIGEYMQQNIKVCSCLEIEKGQREQGRPESGQDRAPKQHNPILSWGPRHIRSLDANL